MRTYTNYDPSELTDRHLRRIETAEEQRAQRVKEECQRVLQTLKAYDVAEAIEDDETKLMEAVRTHDAIGVGIAVLKLVDTYVLKLADNGTPLLEEMPAFEEGR